MERKGFGRDSRMPASWLSRNQCMAAGVSDQPVLSLTFLV